MTAWVLPDHIADVLPSQARHIEELRRRLLDTARGYGYELVMPPLLEHLDSLLTGTGEALDLQTFKLVDQLSGKTLGLRADTTPQAARIDAHLLNRQGLARLCYCGPVLHTRPSSARASREPLQLGCELFGHEGIEADIEVLLLAIDMLKAAQAGVLRVDLADAAVVRSQLGGWVGGQASLKQVHEALARKDKTALAALAASQPQAQREGILALTDLYGGPEVLLEAKKRLLPGASLTSSLSKLEQISQSLPQDVSVSFDLADARGYGYYSGMRFSVYANTGLATLARGGRYDEVGAVFGRNRAAVGFSLDLKDLGLVAPAAPLKAAIRAPWHAQSAGLASAIARLRSLGETVVCMPQSLGRTEVQEFDCDRELVTAGPGQWAVQAISD